VVVVQGSNPPSLDAMTTSSQASRNITMNMYETLYGYGADVAPVPILAEGVEISADGLSYVFTLRQGVKFHNGDIMDAGDVTASLERYRKVGGTKGLLDQVASIEATGPLEVTLRLTEPTPTFLEGFSSPRAPAVIIPAEDAAAEAGKTSLIGTGPYKFVEYVPDSHVKLARFDDYTEDTRSDGINGFGGRKIPWFDTVTFRIISEPGAQVSALETGEVDVVETLTVPAARRLQSDPDITVYENLPWAMSVLILNMSVPPTDNIRFREAVQVALNMEEILAISGEGLYRLNHGWQYPGTLYDAGDIGKEFYNRNDAERARALLKEAGYNGEPFAILTDSQIPYHGRAAVVIAEQLGKVGINAVINQFDWPTVLKMRLQPEGWNAWTSSKGLEPYLGPYGVVASVVGESTHFIVPDERIDALYQQLITGATLEARQETMRQIQARLYEIFGIIKLGDLGIMQAARARVKGFEPFRFTRMYNVWFEE
jgi:peptide/nickel transport system substrate-binding protein